MLILANAVQRVHRMKWVACVFILALPLACRLPLRNKPSVSPGRSAVDFLQHVEKLCLERNVFGLGALFTPECRSQCKGFVPFLVSQEGAYQTARWIPRLTEGELVLDLSAVLLSYRAIQRVRIVPLKMRVFPGRVLFRARMSIEGRDLENYSRLDSGVVDIDLFKELNGWRIQRFRPGRFFSIRREEKSYSLTRLKAHWSQQHGSRPFRVSHRAVDLTIPGRIGKTPFAVFDLDSDGRQEVIFAHGRKVFLFHSRQAEFDSIELLRTLDQRGDIRALTVGDLDGDGDLDLFVGVYGGISQIWINHRGVFNPLKNFAISGHVTDAVIADFNGDEVLDLYVVRHGALKQMPWENGEPNLLYWGTAGEFRDPPVKLDNGWGMAACAGDVNNDGAVDLFVANEFGPSKLYINTGRGRFKDVARTSGISITGLATACALGDVNGDGLLDLAIGGRGSSEGYLLGRPTVGAPGSGLFPTTKNLARFLRLSQGTSLWESQPLGAKGQLRFKKILFQDVRWVQSLAFNDHDADGDLDLFASFFDLPKPLEQKWWWDVMGAFGEHRQPASPLLIHHLPLKSDIWFNVDDKEFSAIDSLSGLNDKQHYGLATLANPTKLSNDLIIDEKDGMIGAHFQGSPETHHHLWLRVQAKGKNRFSIGARVELWIESQRQIREVGLSASGLFPSPPDVVHFGLGEHLRAEKVRVRWPNGDWQDFEDLPVDCMVTVRQGGVARWGNDEKQITPQNAPDTFENPLSSENNDFQSTKSDDLPSIESESSSSSGPSQGSRSPSSKPSFLPHLRDLHVISGEKTKKLSSIFKTDTVVLMIAEQSSLTSRKLCQIVFNSLKKARCVDGGVLFLRKGSQFKCRLKAAFATKATAQALRNLRSLLPAVAVFDRRGINPLRLLSGHLTLSELRAQIRNVIFESSGCP